MFSYRTYKAEALLKKELLPKKCGYCGGTQENNFDPKDGKLYALELGYRDKNSRNQNPRNLVFVCRRCKDLLRGKILIKKTPSIESLRRR